jgi:cyclopropane fatty-acyl-phospholipid synthase-like methyltransferase
VSNVGSEGTPRARPAQAIDDFDASYQGTPPWDIGRPQPVFLGLAEAGFLRGRVLDAGCGTGEHVLMAAERGLQACGVDAAPKAIAAAERKAQERGLTARFLVWDALRLDELGEHFDTVLDSGLFHVFDDDSRSTYVETLGAVLEPGGRMFLCCFSDREPGDWGPRRISEDEIRVAFERGWDVESIEAVQFITNRNPAVAEAWLATIARR